MLPNIAPAPSGKCAVFTICSNNYLAYATTLLNSLGQHEPTIDRYLILADKKVAPADLYPDNASIVCVEDLLIPEFDKFAFRYDIMEFNTAIKPFAALHLLEALGYDSVIYLDPDIEVFAPLNAITHALEEGASVVLTPHVCHPAEGDVVPNDLQFLQAGTYNLGFCAWGKTKEALSTLRWWARRLEHQCVNEVARGLFVDQKFIDLVPGFLQKVAILRDPSLNVAYWNLSQRDLQKKDSTWIVDAAPLTFFHFSGFLPTKLDALSKHTPMFQGRKISPSLALLLKHYSSQLFENGYGKVPKGTYPWERFQSGAHIHPSIRRMFRENYATWDGNPFTQFQAVIERQMAVEGQSISQNSSALSPVSAHMLYLRDGLNWLQFMYDPSTESGARALANWYVDTGGTEWNLDARLLALTITKLANKPPQHLPPPSGQGRADVSLIGYLKTTSGVGEIARRNLQTLSTLAYLVEAKDIGLKVGGARLDTRFDALEANQVSGRIQIFNINADQITPVLEHLGQTRWPDSYKIATPFWELDKFPAKFAPDLEHFDELWASSRHIEALLYRQFRDKPVIYMPPDLTPALKSNRTRASFGLRDDEFVVFYAFDFLSQLERKNPKGAYAAFRRAFGRSEGAKRARFVLKTLNGKYAPPAYAAWQQELLEDPDVFLIEETLDQADMLALIGCADVVLSLHRAEGLGLLVADAIGQGVPLVTTDWSGTTDLIDHHCGYPVSFTLVPTPPDAYPYVDSHHWAEPDLDHAAWQLASIYRDRDQAGAKTKRARAQLVTKFGPGMASKKMAQRLGELLGPTHD
jgi:glycosyltransferase involved in cell wall biosynthesis